MILGVDHCEPTPPAKVKGTRMNEKIAAIRSRPIKSICQKKSVQRWEEVRDLSGEGRFARAPDLLARTSAEIRTMKRGMAITGKMIPNIPDCQPSTSTSTSSRRERGECQPRKGEASASREMARRGCTTNLTRASREKG